MSLILGIIISFVLVSVASSQTAEDMKRLHKKLFTTDEYNKNVRPAANYTDLTYVEMNFSLVRIHSVDEVKQTFTIFGFFDIFWRDTFLIWDPLDYGGIKFILVPQDDIWKPDIGLRNTNAEYKNLGSPSLNVLVTYYGLISWSPLQALTSTCTITVRHFPFDTQECELWFVAWSSFDGNTILKSGTSDIDLNFLRNDQSWTIEKAKAIERDNGEADFLTGVVLLFKIRRKPLQFILTVFLPVVMLSYLSTAAFVIPCDSGERVSFAISVFLAFAVFQLIINDQLPETSDEFSLIGLYVIIEIAQSTLIIFITLLFMRKVNSNKRVPGFVLRLVCARRNVKVGNLAMRPEEINETSTMHASQAFLRSDLSWKDAIQVLDVLCFVAFFASDCILLSVIMIIFTQN